MSADAILTRLAEITKLIESYRGAAFLLDLERQELQLKLRQTNWAPPQTPAQLNL